jgi:hypothetical protein
MVPLEIKITGISKPSFYMETFTCRELDSIEMVIFMVFCQDVSLAVNGHAGTRYREFFSEHGRHSGLSKKCRQNGSVRA